MVIALDTVLTSVIISKSGVICIFHDAQVLLKSYLEKGYNRWCGMVYGADVFVLGVLVEVAFKTCVGGWDGLVLRKGQEETAWAEVETGLQEVLRAEFWCSFIFPCHHNWPWPLCLKGDKVRTVQGRCVESRHTGRGAEQKSVISFVASASPHEADVFCVQCTLQNHFSSV